MAGEREDRPSQLDARGKELQLKKPDLGKRAYQFIIQGFLPAFEDTPEFQQRFKAKYDILRKTNPHAGVDEWDVDYDKGDYHYDAFYDHYPKSDTTTKVGKDSLQLIIVKKHHKFLLEELLLQVSYDQNEQDIQFDSGAISHLEYHSSDGIRNPSSGTPTAVQRVEGFLKTNFPQPQSQSSPQQ